MRRVTPLLIVAGLLIVASFSQSSSHSWSHAKNVGANTKSAGLLLDRGGPVLLSSTTYALFWGPSSSFPADLRSGIEAELNGLANSSYLAIADQYQRGAGATATSFGGSLFDPSAPPKSAPNVQALANEVAKVIGSANLTRNAIYLVYTSNNPVKNYCAWHDQATVGSVPIQVGYLPNTSNVAGCLAPAVGVTPWSNATRSLQDSTAHEFMEAVTDPKPGSAWLDRNGLEIGDKCETAPESVVLLGGTAFEIQSEWSNATSSCVFGV